MGRNRINNNEEKTDDLIKKIKEIINTHDETIKRDYEQSRLIPSGPEGLFLKDLLHKNSKKIRKSLVKQTVEITKDMYSKDNRESTQLFKEILSFYQNTKELIQSEFGCSSIKRALKACLNTDMNDVVDEAPIKKLLILNNLYDYWPIRIKLTQLSLFIFSNRDIHFILSPSEKQILSKDQYDNLVLSYIDNKNLNNDERNMKKMCVYEAIIKEYANPLSAKRLFKLCDSTPYKSSQKYLIDFLSLSNVSRKAGRPDR